MVEFRNNQIYDDNGKLIGKGQGEIYEDHIGEKKESKVGFFFDILDFILDIVDIFL